MTNGPSELDLATALTVGRIVAAHGLRGEVKVDPLTDFPERFHPGARLWLNDQPITIERSRWQGKLVYLKLPGIDTRTAAEALRGAELLAPATKLEDGLYYLHDIIGLEVRDQADNVLGHVGEIMTTGANDVYVVRGAEGELLLPAIDDTVLEVRPADGYLRVDVPDGLEFTAPKAAAAKRPARRKEQATTATNSAPLQEGDAR